MWCYILFAAWAIYAFFIVRLLRKVLSDGLKHLRDQDPEVAQKYEPFRRTDLGRWNHTEIYLVAIFLGPAKIFGFLFGVICCFLSVKYGLRGLDYQKELPDDRRKLIRGATRLFARICLFSIGFFYIRQKKLRIQDFDPTYPKDGSDRKAPIVICNHITMWDIFMMLRSKECPSFLSKKDVESYPMVGVIAKGIQTLFVEREKREQKDAIMSQITQRINDLKEKPGSFPQILIYPEGTTTNGDYLISFKKGAFVNLAPVQIVLLKYEHPRFNPSLDALGTLQTFLMSLFHFYHPITIYDLGTYDPAHLNLKSEDDWKIYADKVKAIMLNVLKVKPSEQSFSDKNVYFDYLKKLISSSTVK